MDADDSGDVVAVNPLPAAVVAQATRRERSPREIDGHERADLEELESEIYYLINP